jgi:hypothetical protein
MIGRRVFSLLAVVLTLLAWAVVVASSSSAATGAVVSTVPVVQVRSGPGDSNALVQTIAAGSTVSFHCYVAGEPSTGPYGTEDLWDALDGGGYVPDALIYTHSNTAIVPACPSSQFGVGVYPVAWTGGGGFNPRDASTLNSASSGVLPDGLLVSITCETFGDTLTDSVGYTSNRWDRLSNGAYVPNVYLDTQVNGATPGMASCVPASEPGPTGVSSTPVIVTAQAPPSVLPTSPKAPTPTGAPTTPAGSETQNPVGSGTNIERDAPDCLPPAGADVLPYVGTLPGPLATQLFQHYLYGHGKAVELDWRYFSNSQGFSTAAQALGTGYTGQYRAPADSTLYDAFGTFRACHITSSTYGFFDGYDYTPDKITNIPYIPLWALRLAGATNFNEYATGPLS